MSWLKSWQLTVIFLEPYEKGLKDLQAISILFLDLRFGVYNF